MRKPGRRVLPAVADRRVTSTSPPAGVEEPPELRGAAMAEEGVAAADLAVAHGERRAAIHRASSVKFRYPTA